MPLSRRNRKASRKASRKNMRKGSRKNMRKASRKNKKNSRKASRKCWSRKASRKNMRRNRRQHGGSAMGQSLAQGQQYAALHRSQHGGAMLSGAPVSAITDSMLPGDLRSFARIGGLDDSIAAAATQRDPDQMPLQKGGRRARNSRKNRNSRKGSRKAKGKKASRKTKSSRKSSRRSRRQYGGAMGAPYNQPTMLLSASEAAKAGTADFSNPLLKH
jgi:hypothetical protein